MRRLSMVLLLVILSGCGGEKKDPLAVVPETIPESSKQISRVFESAPPRIKTHTDKLIQAYESGNLEEAAGTIIMLQENRELDFDQQMTIRNARGTLEKNLARGVESGDPKAIAAWRRLQGTAARQQ